MKKRINGKTYDTENSELVYRDTKSNALFMRTDKGDFFTLYPNGDIVPRTEEHAKIFLCDVDADKYIELFGNVQEA